MINKRKAQAVGELLQVFMVIVLAGIVAGSLAATVDFLVSLVTEVIEFRHFTLMALTYFMTFALVLGLTVLLGAMWVMPLTFGKTKDGIAAAAVLGLLVTWCSVTFAVAYSGNASLVLSLFVAPLIAAILYSTLRDLDTRVFNLRLPVFVAAQVVFVSFGLATIKWLFYNPMAVIGLRSPSRLIVLTCFAMAVTVFSFGTRRHRIWLSVSISISVAAIGVAFLLSRPGEASAQPPLGSDDSPKVARAIIITLDTLRPDALSCYNPDARKTPGIDSLARDGVLFRKALSPAPWTLPSMVSIMTGVSPFIHGVALPEQDADLPMLSDYFRDAGYQSIALVGNSLLGPSPQRLRPEFRTTFLPVGGFDDWSIFLPYDALGTTIGGGLAKILASEPGRDYRRGSNTEGIRDAAEQWIRANAEDPFLMWVHLFDPHWPYAPPGDWMPSGVEPPSSIGPLLTREFHRELWYGQRALDRSERAWVRALYQADVGFADAAVGRLLATLKEEGLYDDSLILLTSDHGEEFWEHGRYGHGHSLYSEVVDVPFIIKPPGSTTSKVVTSAVSNQAILPTVLDICGIPYEPQAGWMPSLAPLSQADAADEYAAVIINTGFMLDENRAAVLSDGYRYIVNLESGQEALYDITADPGETESLLTQEPDEATRARDLLDSHRREARKIRAALGLSDDKGERFDDETMKRLKSLGYL